MVDLSEPSLILSIHLRSETSITTRTVSSTWQGGWHATVEAGKFTVEVDEPPEVGGTDLGPQPTDYFLVSIASCFTLALSHAARKRSVELTHLSVEVEGEYDGPRFKAVHIRASVGAPEADLPALVAGAERVCYVTNTLNQGVVLTTEAVSAGP